VTSSSEIEIFLQLATQDSSLTNLSVKPDHSPLLSSSPRLLSPPSPFSQPYEPPLGRLPSDSRSLCLAPVSTQTSKPRCPLQHIPPSIFIPPLFLSPLVALLTSLPRKLPDRDYLHIDIHCFSL
ncbi:hypothetical protein ILYODFUR_037611, partial [Ilyodon furcidens]